MRNVYSAIVVFLFLMCGVSVKELHAQERASLVLQGSLGAREDILESVCGGGAQKSFGGSIHYFLTRKNSVGAEVLGFNHCSQRFTYYAPRLSSMLQATHHFGDGRVRPYVIGGVGLIYHKPQHSSGLIKFDAAGGAGAKVFVSKRVYVAPEVQFGTLTTVRGSINVGFFLR